MTGFLKRSLRAPLRVLPLPRYVFCIHEAGHATAATAIGSRWSDMRIESGDEMIVTLRFNSFTWSRLAAIQLGIMSFAGTYTEDRMRTIYPRLVGGCDTDMEVLRNLRFDEREAKLVERTTRGIISKHRAAIRKLAARFDRAGYLKGTPYDPQEKPRPLTLRGRRGRSHNRI